MTSNKIPMQVNKLSFFNLLAITLTSILFGATTLFAIALMTPDTWYGPIGIFILSYMPAVSISVSLMIAIPYFYFFRYIAKKKPETAGILWLVIIFAGFMIYTRLGIGDKMYPAKIVANTNDMTQGDAMSFSVIPEVSNYEIRRIPTLQLILRTPSGKIIKNSIVINPDCSRKCIATSQPILMRMTEDQYSYDNLYASEAGTYSITSENPLIKGLDFTVRANPSAPTILNSRGIMVGVEEQKLFPTSIGTYSKIKSSFEYTPSGAYGESYKMLYKSATVSDTQNLGVRISFNPKTTYNPPLYTQFENTVSRNGDFNGETGIIIWQSGNKHIELSGYTQPNNYRTDFLKSLLTIYPSTLAPQN